MTGSITKHLLTSGRYSWGYVFTTGRDAAGKRVQVVKKGFKTKKEADDALRIALGPKGPTIATDGRLFGTFFNEWLIFKGATKWGKMTAEQNAKRATYAIRLWGDVPLHKLEPAQLEAGFTKLLLGGGKNGFPLSPKTVNSVIALVSQALDKAVDSDFLLKNPMNKVERPAANKAEVSIPQADDFEKLLGVLQGTRYYAFVVMAAASGMRRGELLALRWSDIDTKTGTVTVSKAVSETKAGLEIKSTKSRKTRFVRVTARPCSAIGAPEANRTREGTVCRGLRAARPRVSDAEWQLLLSRPGDQPHLGVHGEGRHRRFTPLPAPPARFYAAVEARSDSHHQQETRPCR